MRKHIVITGLMLGLCAASLQAAPAIEASGVEPLDVEMFSLATTQETSKHVAGEPRMSMHQLEGAIDMTVIAKVRCTHKSLHQHQMPDGSTGQAASLKFSAVQATDGKDYQQQLEENKIFGTHTPNLDLSTYITNPGAHSQFELDEEYYLTFEKAPTREHGPTKKARDSA
jgi:hypothetical protein